MSSKIKACYFSPVGKQIPFQELIGAFERYDVVNCDVLNIESN